MLVDHRGRPFSRKKNAKLIVLSSPTGEAPWTPLNREQVPDWVQDPDVMGRMVHGEMCRTDGDWYIAVHPNEIGQVPH